MGVALGETPPASSARALAAVAAAAGMIAGPPIFMRIFPFVLKPISEEFGWGRTTFSLMFTIASLTAALLSPPAGRLIDRYGPRPVAIAGMLFFATGISSLALITGSKVQLALHFFVMGIGGATAGPIAFNKVVAGWFTKRRGLALALIIGGSGSAAGFFLSWLAQWAVTSFGWRISWLVFGSISFLSIPVLWFWLREQPLAAATGAGARGLGASGAPGDSVRQALRSRNFWLLVGALLLASVVQQGLTQHLVAMLTDNGVTRLVATSATAVGPLAVLCGQLSMGFLADRVSSPKLIVPFLLLSVAGLYFLTHTQDPVLLNVSSFVFNFGLGADNGFAAYVITRYFGLKNFSAIIGFVLLWTVICTGLGPTVYGVAFDYFGSYNVVVMLSLATLCVSAGLMSLLGRYRYSPDLNRVPQATDGSDSSTAPDGARLRQGAGL